MKLNVFLAILILISNFTSLYPETRYIELDSTYCNGSLKISNLGYHGDNYEFVGDTIEFSNNTRMVSFGCQDYEALYICGMGGFAVTNADAQIFFKYEANLSRGYMGHIANTDYCWQFSFVENRTDTLWNMATSLPAQLYPPDSFAHKPDTNPDYWQASYFYSFAGDEIGMFPNYSVGPLNSYNAISYLKCGNKRSIKLQMYHYKLYKIPSGPSGDTVQRIGDVMLRWAADSMGNGIFINDTSDIINQNIVQSNNETFPKFSKIKNCIYFHEIKPNAEAYIYNLQGALMKSERLSSKNRDIKLNFPDGMYILSVVNSKKRYSTRIFIR